MNHNMRQCRLRGGWIGAAVLGLALAGCAETEFVVDSSKAITRQTPPGQYKVGRPYQIAGVWYYPTVDYDYNETGIASWYGSDFHGLATANGEQYDMNGLTAAHRTLPLPSMVLVTNLENGKKLKVRVNDRGPFVDGRIIDLSQEAARKLGFETKGQGERQLRLFG